MNGFECLAAIKQMPRLLEENKNMLTEKSIVIFKKLYEQFKIYDDQVKQYDVEIEIAATQDIRCKEIMKIEIK